MPEAKLQNSTIEVWNKSDLLHSGTLAAMQDPRRTPYPPRGPTMRSMRLSLPAADKETEQDPGASEDPGQGAEASVRGNSSGAKACEPSEAVPSTGGGEGHAGGRESMGVQEATDAIQHGIAWDIVEVTCPS